MPEKKKIYDFLKQNRDIAFATVGSDGKPRIRGFQIMKTDENTHTLYFATGPGKEVYKQLQQNPSVELLCMSGGISVRIAGDAVFDVPDATAQEIYSTNSVLSWLYEDYRKLVYFRISIVSLDYYDLNVDPPVLESYNF